MERPTSNIEQIGEEIRSNLTIKYAVRERALQLTRQAIRHCANAIRAMHRDQFKDAEDLVDSAHILLGELGDALAEHSDLFHSGFVYDAQKEYTEAKITLALLSHQQIPNPNELGVSYPAYLNGLAEAASELRRYLLDSLRKGKDENCEQLFEMMDDIYSLLVTIDFPDSLTGGLRRSTDVLRGVMEKTRGDLTLFLKQGELATKIDRCFQREKGGKFNGSHKG